MLAGVIGGGLLSLTTKLILTERSIDSISSDFGNSIGLYSFNNTSSSELKQINSSVQDVVNKSDVIFIAVDTDISDSYILDDLDIISLAEQIGNYIDSYKLIVIKSLVPVGTCNKIKSIINDKIKSRNSLAIFDIIYNPEFYDNDDSYIDVFADSISPSSIIIGIDKQKSLEIYLNLLSRLYDNDTLRNLNIMSIESAEISAFYSAGTY